MFAILQYYAETRGLDPSSMELFSLALWSGNVYDYKDVQLVYESIFAFAGGISRLNDIKEASGRVFFWTTPSSTPVTIVSSLFANQAGSPWSGGAIRRSFERLGISRVPELVLFDVILLRRPSQC